VESVAEYSAANPQQPDATLRDGVGRACAALNDPDFAEYVTGAEDGDHQTLAALVWRADPYMPSADSDGIHGIRHIAVPENSSTVARLKHSATRLDPIECRKIHSLEG
jgi:hypothetical protein